MTTARHPPPCCAALWIALAIGGCADVDGLRGDQFAGGAPPGSEGTGGVGSVDGDESASGGGATTGSDPAGAEDTGAGPDGDASGAPGGGEEAGDDAPDEPGDAACDAGLPAGEILWEQVYVTAQQGINRAFVAIAPDGRTSVALETLSGGFAQYRVELVQVSIDGVLLGAPQVWDDHHETRVFDVAVNDQGVVGVAVMGDPLSNADPEHVGLWVIDGSGAVSGAELVTGHLSIEAVTVAADDGFVAVGARFPFGGGYEPHFTRFDASGEVVVDHTLDSYEHVTYESVASLPDGWIAYADIWNFSETEHALDVWSLAGGFLQRIPIDEPVGLRRHADGIVVVRPDRVERWDSSFEVQWSHPVLADEQLVAVSDGTTGDLALGTWVAGESRITMLDADGSVRWQRILPDAVDDLDVDACGGVIAVSASGDELRMRRLAP